MQRLALLLVVLPALASAAISCRDNDGNPVDWFAAIKFPGGTNYVSMMRGERSFSSTVYDLTKTDSGAVTETLDQIYNGDAQDYVMYNDQDPSGKDHDTFGHSKGTAAWSTSDGQGFYLIHSIPHFPSPASAGPYQYPSSGFNNGQSFICLTLSMDELDDIADGWRYTRPYIYDKLISNSISSYPNMDAVINNGAYTKVAGKADHSIKTIGGQYFHYLVKNANWGQDIYANFIAPYYQQDLLVESWMNGVGKLPTWCAGTNGLSYSAEDIVSLELNGVSWTETKDHSKWCVSKNSNIVCIGDINRQHGQEGRSGGMMCFEQTSLHNQLSDAITDVDGCTSSNLLANDARTSSKKDNKADKVVIIVSVVGAVFVAATIAAVLVVLKRRSAGSLNEDTELISA